MAKGNRTTIAPNIARYPDGQLEAEVRITGCPRQLKRFARDTDLTYIRTWIAETHAALRADSRAFGGMTPADRRLASGTLEGDAPSFLSQIAGREGFKSDRSHLRAWFAVVVDGTPLGALPRPAITSRHINTAIAWWQTKPSAHAIRKVRVRGYTRADVAIAAHAIKPTTVRSHARGGPQAGAVTSYARQGSVIAAHPQRGHTVEDYERTAPATSGHVVAARTIRHRCRVLAELYHTLDGKRTATPVDEAKIPKRPKTPPMVVPADVVESVLRKLITLDRLTYARFAVVTTTGQRPCQVGRAQPEDVDLEERTWFVRDAKGEPAHTITLNSTQVAAWKAFLAADAWGAFDTSQYGKQIHLAGWPKGVRPYVARHAIAVDAIRRGVSLGDVQGLLGHADPSTTRIYAGFVVDRQRAVSKTMTPYLADHFKLKKVKG
jgi:integrase